MVPIGTRTGQQQRRTAPRGTGAAARDDLLGDSDRAARERESYGIEHLRKERSSANE
jgi:hypothetical protein